MVTVDGHPRVLTVNVLAPYMLTALMHRPERLNYLSSMMHTLGSTSLDDIEWSTRPWHPAQAYGDSKLFSRRSPRRSHDAGPTSVAAPSTPDGFRPEWAAPAPPTTWPSAT